MTTCDCETISTITCGTCSAEVPFGKKILPLLARAEAAVAMMRREALGKARPDVLTKGRKKAFNAAEALLSDLQEAIQDLSAKEAAR